MADKGGIRQRLGQHLYWLLAPHYFTRWGRLLLRLFDRVFRGYSFYVFKRESIERAFRSDIKPLFPQEKECTLLG